MSVRSRVADRPVPAVKAFGGSEPPAMQAAAEDVSQMGMAHPFAPGEPIGPYDGYSRTPRSQNFVTGYNIATRPRTHERVSFETLRGLIDNYDVAQIAIWHRIDSIRSLDWKLVAEEHYEGDVTDAIPVGMAALKKPDRIHFFETWLGKWLWDVLAYDAGALYRLRNRGGRCVGLLPVDGKTIAPLLDYWGNPPEEPAEAYVQYVNGLPWGWLTRGDLVYEPYRLHNDSVYGRAPIESIILNANTDIRFQVYFLQRFTEGNLPAAFAAAPESWSPDQIEQFQEYWDGFMYGDQGRKHQIRWMPGGTSFAWSDEKEFTDHFSLFLMRKTAAAYHVVPADLGFTENVNRSSGESQADVQHRVGDLPFVRYIQRIISSFLQDDLGLPLRFAFDLGEEQADRVQQAQADKVYVDMGAISASDIREMRYGMAEPGGVPVPRYIFTERAGPIPLSSLYAVAGQIDPATAAPEPGVPLPQKVFGGTEGVLPNPPIKVMSLAEQEFGESAMPPAPPPQPRMAAIEAPAPVAKDGEGGAATAGITSETGITGYDLIRRDDDEDEDQAGDQAAVAKSELAAFRRFRQARRKAGAWRDFTFGAVPPVQAHRLNDAGRLAVRKAAGEIAVAGLAVLAEDTGRVLMLQRALCDDDPAAGTWEFPGGHLEGDEKPVAAAAREWSEETGCILPFAPEAAAGLAFGNGAGWTSGIYAGFVYPVPSEDCVPVRSGTQVTNPDDPDGDQVEAIAWFDPAQLPGNPALRPELLADIDAVMAALDCSPAGDTSCCGVECCAGACCGGAGGCGCGAHACEPVSKAGDQRGPKDRKGREWPGWKLDHKTVAHWAPQVTTTVTGALPRPRLNRIAGDYLAAHPGQQGDAPGKRDRNDAASAWLTGQGVTLPLDDLAPGIVTDGYLIGAVSAAAMVSGLKADTDGWQPGDDGKAGERIAELAAAAALGTLLGSAGDSADQMAGGYLDALGRVLAGADAEISAEDLGGALSEAIASEDLAASLVMTQITTATGTAAQDYYMAHGVGYGRWVTEGDTKVCEAICLPNAAAGQVPIGQPYPSGHVSQPGHNRCRCAVVPEWA
jgi:8-oxo-dGTP pyrophosphatase MutT (NUDIX family)